MFQLKDLLKKIAHIEDPKETRNQMSRVLNHVLGADLVTSENIEYKDFVLRLNTNPAIKQKIFISKARCMELLSNALPSHKITDIR